MADANKKRVIILCASILALFSAILFFMRTADLSNGTVPVISQKILGKIEKGNAMEGDFDFDLLFRGVKIPYDVDKNCFYLPVNMAEEKFSNKISAADGVEIFFETNFEDMNLISCMEKNEKIPFYALKDDSYRKCFLVLTGLPVMTIDATDYVMGDGNALYTMKLLDPLEREEFEVTALTSAAFRGNTSMEYPKKSFRLRLFEMEKENQFKKKNENLLGLRKDDDWILNSLYADESRMRDKLCIDLWEELGAEDNPYGLNLGTRMEYVEVFVNNHYQGLYGLSFPVDEKQTGISNEGKAPGKQEFLYKKKYASFWNSEDFTGPLLDENMPDYRGGFQIKGKGTDYSIERFEALRQLAFLMESSDEEFTKGTERMLSVENVVNNWLFYQAIAGFDNLGKNYYYLAKQSGNGFQGYFIPWDMNVSFGAVVTEENDFYVKIDPNTCNDLVAWEPGQRFVETNTENAKQVAKEKWAKWRANTLSKDQFSARVNEMSNLLTKSGALLREQETWVEGNCTGETKQLLDYFEKRMEMLDEYFSESLQ